MLALVYGLVHGVSADGGGALGERRAVEWEALGAEDAVAGVEEDFEGLRYDVVVLALLSSERLVPTPGLVPLDPQVAEAADDEARHASVPLADPVGCAGD